MAARKRIPTEGPGEGGLGQNPFDGLSASGLDRPSTPAPGPTPRPKAPTSLGRVEIRREKSGRGGKTVTTVTAFEKRPHDVADLLRKAKQAAATGGTAYKDGFLVQGDHRETVSRILEERGFRPVRAGG